jgi:hypothetical protein
MLKNLDTVSMLFCDSTLQKYNVLSEVHIGAQKTPPPKRRVFRWSFVLSTVRNPECKVHHFRVVLSTESTKVQKVQ